MCIHQSTTSYVFKKGENYVATIAIDALELKHQVTNNQNADYRFLEYRETYNAYHCFMT